MLAAVEAVHRLAELGAGGITFHDDDDHLIPPAAATANERGSSTGSRSPLDETGMVVPMATTNLFGDPGVKDVALTSNDPLHTPLRHPQGHAEHGPRRRARRDDECVPGGREGSEVEVAKDVRSALDREASSRPGQEKAWVAA
jgi:xylose isomerase